MGLSVVQFAPPKTYTDTGWIPFAVNGPVSVGSDGCSYRIMDGICHVQVHVAYSGPFAAGFVIATLPPECRPTKTHWFAGLWYGGASFEFKVFTNGNLSNSGASNGSPGGLVVAADWPVG